MVSFNLPELSLDLSPPCSKIPEFLTQVPVTRDWDSHHESAKLNDFINRLEDELSKIQAFKRELPLSFLLLNDAISKLKEEANCQRERRKEGIFDDQNVRARLEVDDQFDKKTWMSSAQLWSPRSEEDDQSQEFKEDTDSEPGLSLVTPGLKPPTVDEPGLTGTGGIFPGPVFSTVVDQAAKPEINKPGYNNQTARKQRRCWSPELHRRFVDALEKLGGSQVATPKQIRELMKVEGLTNDEVKSHLQKYRLHVRKLPSSKASTHPSSTTEESNGREQLELDCSKLEPPHSGSPEGPLHLAKSGKCNSTSMEEDEDDEKSDGQSWKVQYHRKP